MQTLIKQNAVLRITDGSYDQSKTAFKFHLNGKPVVLPLSDPDITGIGLFREAFGKDGEVLQERSTKCGPFSFGFYIWLCAGIRQPTRNTSFLGQAAFASLRG